MLQVTVITLNDNHNQHYPGKNKESMKSLEAEGNKVIEFEYLHIKGKRTT